MMKKSTCFLILIALILTLTACESNETPPIVGTWEYSNHSELKDYLTDQLDDSFFFKVYYQFNEDGTGNTWTKSYPHNKLSVTYTFDEDTLSVTLDNGQVQELECEFHETYFYVSDGKEDMKFEKIQ